jgi:hypothetical protein
LSSGAIFLQVRTRAPQSGVKAAKDKANPKVPDDLPMKTLK